MTRQIADHKNAENTMIMNTGEYLSVNACTSEKFHVVNSNFIVHASPQCLRLSQPAIFVQSSQSKLHCYSAPGLNERNKLHTQTLLKLLRKLLWDGSA